MNQPLPVWRRAAIFGLQSLHTLVFFAESACVFAILFAAAANRITRWTWWAIAIIAGEGALLALFRMQCPLRLWTEQLGAERGAVTDLFLPRWLADRIFQIFTPLYVIGTLGVLLRKWQAAK